jgi:hypothetical protein
MPFDKVFSLHAYGSQVPGPVAATAVATGDHGV